MLVTLTGCEVFGLDVQEPYDYDSEKGKYDNHINMNAWEFMNSRTDIFSEMLSAIKYSGVDTLLYAQPNCTYLLLTNTSLTSATATDRSFWYENQYMRSEDDPEFVPDAEDPSVNMIVPTSWEEIPRQTVKDMLMYHIIKGYTLLYNCIDQTDKRGAIISSLQNVQMVCR